MNLPETQHPFWRYPPSPRRQLMRERFYAEQDGQWVVVKTEPDGVELVIHATDRSRYAWRSQTHGVWEFGPGKLFSSLQALDLARGRRVPYVKRAKPKQKDNHVNQVPRSQTITLDQPKT
jgi:hypothetical protein